MLNFSFSKVFNFLSFSSFPLLLFFNVHSRDLKIMFLSPMQIKAIAEKSRLLVQIGVKAKRVNSEAVKPIWSTMLRTLNGEARKHGTQVDFNCVNPQ